MGHTHMHLHAHTHTQTAGCLKPSQDLALISPLSLFRSFLSHSLPLSSQIAAAFDVLQKTIAGASALLYDSNSSLAPVESALMIVSFSIPFNLFPCHSEARICFLQDVFLSEILIHTSTRLNFWPLTFHKRALFTCGGTPPLLLSMLIEFLCGLIKRIEFASAVGCYMASWIRTHTLA